MRILSLSSRGTLCGIAAYDAALKDAFEAKGHVYDVEPIDPASLANASVSELVRHFRRFPERAADYDAVVLQHEWGFFMGATGLRASYAAFSSILAGLRDTGKPIFVLFHSAFPVHPAPARRLFRWGKDKYDEYAELQRELISELNLNPRLHPVVHGRLAKRMLADLGVEAAKIKDIAHPVPVRPLAGPVPLNQSSSSGEINLLIFGFVRAYKGYDMALAALRLLPNNFKLVIAGGKHPLAPRDRTLDAVYGYLHTGEWLLQDPNSIAPLTEHLGVLSEPERSTLRARVHVTGSIRDEELLPTVAMADIVLAPYSDQGPPGSGALNWAFVAERPVVATAVHTFVEIQEDWGCMKLVAPGSAFELAETIRGLAENPGEKADLVAKGHAFASANSFDALADTLLSMLAPRRVGSHSAEASC
jgi:glycosyltransferase involved in cell wall biosynthesis